MANKSIQISNKLLDYICDVSVKEHRAQHALREATAPLHLANMQIAPEQGQFLQFLLKLNRAKKVLELGTFTGYSALTMALALPDEGKVISCDISDQWESIARTHWQQAGMETKIDFRIGPAIDTLKSLQNNDTESFDFIFIDADKTNYPNYYQQCLTLLKPGGLMAIDNMFWDGKVIDENSDDADTLAIREVAEMIKNDTQVFSCLVPIADGLFLIQK